MANLENIMKEKNSKFGDNTIFFGNGLRRDPPRIPSGVFSVDYVTGGGFPVWGTSCLWGPESGGKSTLATSIMAAVQHMCWRCFKFDSEVCSIESMTCDCDEGPLLQRSFWADVEGTLDAVWAEAIGADPNRYMVCLGEYGEQYINLIDAALQADDSGLVVVDSIANLTPLAELEAPTEDQFMAVQARLISRCVHKIKSRLIKERRRGHPCAVVVTNQMRSKIGVLFGSPETMPGGWALKHEFSMLLRCVKKALKKEGSDGKFVDSKSQKNSAERFAFSVKKAKVLTLAGVGEYIRLTEPFDDLGLRMGEVYDYNIVKKYANDLDLIKKVSDHYECLGRNFGKVQDMLDHWRSHPYDYFALQREIIRETKRRKYAL